MRCRVLILPVVLVLACGSAAQSKAGARPDVKVRTRTTAAGSATETVSLIKGTRMRQQRVGTADEEIVLLYQCDRSRVLQISPANKTYRVVPLDDITSATTSPSGAPTRSPRPARAGAVTFTTTLRETGLRRKMRGHDARNIQTETTTEATPGSCAAAHPVKMKSDGWFIDFPGVNLACADGDRVALRLRPEDPTCPVQPSFRSEGTAWLGFPISLTTTMATSKGEVKVTQETLSLDAATLDAALFEVPEGYRQVASQAALLEPAEPLPPAEANPTVEGQLPLTRSSRSTRTGEPRPALTRVCLVHPDAPTKDLPDAFWLQLKVSLNRAGVEPVTMQAKAAAETLAAEAKEKACRYMLYIDSPGPLTMTYKLFEAGSPRVRLESSAKADEGESWEKALEKIASEVGEAIQRDAADRKPIP